MGKGRETQIYKILRTTAIKKNNVTLEVRLELGSIFEARHI